MEAPPPTKQQKIIIIIIRRRRKEKKREKDFGPIWHHDLNNIFQFLNNITRISTHFFTHTYFQEIQTTLLEQHYQTDSLNLPFLNFLTFN